MSKRFRKGSSEGMPILAIVGVVATLAGLGVIFQVIGNVSNQTGEDYDRRELFDLGASIENKCADVSSETSDSSVTPITVGVEIRSDVQIKSTPADNNDFIDSLYLDFEQDETTYNLPADTCDINYMNESDTIDAGQYQAVVEHTGSGSNDKPNIKVVLN